MTTRSSSKARRLVCFGFIHLIWASIPFSMLISAAASATGWPAAIETQRILIALNPRTETPSSSTPGRKIEGEIAEARHVLTDLHAFVEEATLVMRLGDELRFSRSEHDRLRRALLTGLAARDAFRHHMRPSETVESALIRTVIRNWLQTVRLRHQSDEAHLELEASQTSWRELQRRLARLRLDLVARRAEIRALRAERAALSIELGRVRQEINGTRARTRHVEREQERIAGAIERLNRNVASNLRRILLESEDRRP